MLQKQQNETFFTKSFEKIWLLKQIGVSLRQFLTPNQ
jgi:hypothetical protein